MKKWFKKKIEDFKNWYWFRFIIKKNEFDSSLDLDHRKMVGKTKEEQNKYMMDLIKKRNLAHELEMKED
jgi:hypothetical protein